MYSFHQLCAQGMTELILRRSAEKTATMEISKPQQTLPSKHTEQYTAHRLQHLPQTERTLNGLSLQRSTRRIPSSISRAHRAQPPAYITHLPSTSSTQHTTAPTAHRAPELPFLHTYTPAARLPSSRAPYLYTSTSAHLQSSRAPYLCLYVYTPTGRLQSSRAPILYTHTPAA